ncbi:MAG: hypothetical protein RM021_008650 [Nostoc sp. EkiNYC01]|nr:hypothetical protein [Nostoc sp. EkiNYC01]
MVFRLLKENAIAQIATSTFWRSLVKFYLQRYKNAANSSTIAM